MMSSKAIVRPPIDYILLKDRSIIVTGGASGLGAACVETFAAHGAYVTIADLDETNGQQLASRLSSQGQHVGFVKCDTTDWASSVQAFKQAASFGPSKTLDVAALFAGISGSGSGLVDLVQKGGSPSLDGDPGPPPSKKIIDVNCTGVFYSSWLALHYFQLPPQIKGQFKKSLILMGHPYNTAYGAAKFGVRGILYSIRDTVNQLNTRVNNVAPGYVLTPLTKAIHGIDSPDQKSKATGTVLPWASLDDVVEATLRCAVDDSVDGRTFMIMPSGPTDLEEDMEAGYGGQKLAQLMKDEGYAELAELLARKK